MSSGVESLCKRCPHKMGSIFSDLDDVQLDDFCGLKQVSHYKKTQRIFYEGEPNTGLFILCSGKVKLSRTSRLGRRQIVGILEPCGLLEEKDLFLGKRHSVTVEAMEDCVVSFVEKDVFLNFMQCNQPVPIQLIEHLSQELELAEGKIEALTVMDAKRRLANLLLQLADRYGVTILQGRLIDLRLTREEIAEMVGTTQETVIRVFSVFKRKGLIQDFGKQIVLTNEERLRKVSN